MYIFSRYEEYSEEKLLSFNIYILLYMYIYKYGVILDLLHNLGEWNRERERKKREGERKKMESGWKGN